MPRSSTPTESDWVADAGAETRRYLASDKHCEIFGMEGYDGGGGEGRFGRG